MLDSQHRECVHSDELVNERECCADHGLRGDLRIDQAVYQQGKLVIVALI